MPWDGGEIRFASGAAIALKRRRSLPRGCFLMELAYMESMGCGGIWFDGIKGSSHDLW